MNKKLFLGMFAAATMLLATSCQNDELDAVQSGNEATVSFTLGVEDGVQTRAISDGKTADLLVYQVLDKDGNAISTLSKVEEKVTFPYELTLTLAKGQTYQIAFWAQNSKSTAYTTTDFPTVEVSYNGINNDETRDAFFKTETVTVTGNAKLDVTLKRPFAQLNVGVYKSDWEAAVTSGVTIKESSVIIKNAGTSIDLRSGKVTGSDDLEVKYTSSAIPTEWLEIELDKQEGINETTEQFHWLSMSYILVNDGSENGKSKATLADVDFTFYSGGDPITLDDGLNNVPVQRNWRTNIFGKLLTGDVTFNIEINPIYDGNYNNGVADELAPGVQYDAVNKTFSISSAEGLMWIADESNKEKDANHELISDNDGNHIGYFFNQTVALTQDIDLKNIKNWPTIGNGFWNAFAGTFEGNGYTISNLTSSAQRAGLFGHAIGGVIKNLNLKNVTLEATEYAGAVAAYTYSQSIENCRVEDVNVISMASTDDRDEAGFAGGIAGYLTVEGGAEYIKNCQVYNANITANGEVGGIIGRAWAVSNNIELSNNLVENTYVTLDVANNTYVADYAGAIVGRARTKSETVAVNLDDNKDNNVTIVVLKGENGVYSVETADDLFAVAAMINSGKDFGSKTIKLTQNIDLGGKNWTPINLYNAEKVLLAEIDGNNKSIKNMTIKGGSDNGFISMTAGTGKLTIKNLTFENPTIETTGSRVGTVIGHQYGQVELNGVKVTNGDFRSTDEKGIKLGGLIGQSEHGAEGAGNATLTLTNCVVEGSVFTGYHTLSGLVAYIGAEDMSSNITDCRSNNNTFYYKDSRSLGTNNPWSSFYNRGGHNDGTVASSCTTTGNEGVNYIADGVLLMSDGSYRISNAAGIEYVVNNADKTEIKINITEDIDGNATLTQRENVKVTVNGNQKTWNGIIVVDGKSRAYATAGLTIQDIDFEAQTLTKNNYINLGIDNNTRYTNNVTIKNCTFTYNGSEEVVAVRQPTAGCKNLSIINCTVNSSMHSMLQASNVGESLKINDCKVYSKNGVNLNNTDAFTMDGCIFDTKGHAIRVGVKGTVNSTQKTFKVSNSSLKSAGDDGDAVIIFRDSATNAKLTLTDTTIEGTIKISGNTESTIIDGTY